MKKNKRNNGLGTAVFIGGKRAKPWVAKITLGQDELGRQIRHNLGTFKTELEALLFLEQFNQDPKPIYVSREKYNRIFLFSNVPYTLIPVGDPKKEKAKEYTKNNCTFEQLFQKFSNQKLMTTEERLLEKTQGIKVKGKFSADYSKLLNNAYKHAEDLYNMPYKNLTTSDFQNLINKINSIQSGSGITTHLIKLLRNLDKYALQEGIITQGFAQYVNNDTATRKTVQKKIMPHKLIKKLLKLHVNKSEQIIKDILLILLFTGLRITELLHLKTSNIFLNENYMVGGAKTEAGKDREIPIHTKIKNIIQKYFDEKNTFLFHTKDGNALSYNSIEDKLKIFRKNHIILAEYSLHECRHTFRTELERLNVKQVIINSILGHKNGNVSLDVYTHISLQEKKMAVNMITYDDNNQFLIFKTS